jgi:hypothetical protein
MTLTITITMDNAAFEVRNGAEVENIVKEFAAIGGDFHVGDSGTLKDSNGNTCGTWQVS